MMFGSTLRVTRPIFGTAIRAAVILLILVLGASEVLARSEPIQALLVAPSVGGEQYQLGPKLLLLDRLVQRGGPIDCIFIGSSMALRGIDPEIVNTAYRHETGHSIKCFNFGLFSLDAAAAGKLARILVQRYHPHLLVYGTSFRDFVESLGVDINGPWVDYMLGQFSFKGWLTANSYAYQYYLAWSNFGSPTFWTDLNARRQFEVGTSVGGYWPRTEVERVETSPDRVTYAGMYSALAHFELSPKELGGLGQLLDASATGTQVLIVEMPVPLNCIQVFERGHNDYSIFVDGLTALTQEKRVPFWLTTDQDLIPADGWADYFHLNLKGSQVFSQWLGTTLGQSVVQGALHDPTS